MADFVNLENTSRPDGKYKEVIDRIKKDGVCPFCPGNLSTYHKKPILKEGVYWILTENMYPYEGAKHHILVIHKKHIEKFEEIVPEAWGEVKSMIESFMKEAQIPGGTFMLRFGDTARTGASVSHLHAQLVSPDGEDENRKPILIRVG